MKKLLIAIACLFALQTANAQITGGIKLGLSSNNVTQDDFIAYRNNSDSLILAVKDAGVGLHGGLFVRIPLAKGFYAQVEPLLGSSRFNYSLDTVNALGVATDFREGFETFLNLDLNLIAGYQIEIAGVKIRAHVGLVPSIVLNSQSDLFDNENYQSNWNSMKFGYLLGGGLDFNAFTLDVNFVDGLGQFGNDITIGGQNYEFDTRPKSTVVTLGYKLFGE